MNNKIVADIKPTYVLYLNNRCGKFGAQNNKKKTLSSSLKQNCIVSANFFT